MVEAIVDNAFQLLREEYAQGKVSREVFLERLEDLELSVQHPTDDASIEFAGTAKTVARVLHKPRTYDDKLIHSYVEETYAPDIMLTSAIPYDMNKDFDFLYEDSEKAKRELEEFEWYCRPTEEEGSEKDAISRGNKELMDRWQRYNFESAVLQSRILTDDDVLAWKVMTPFCYSLPEKLVEAWMAGKKTGARAGHGVTNVGSILNRENALADKGSGTLSKLVDRIRGRK